MVYNSAKSAVTVTSNYTSTSLKSTDYESSVITITGAARTKALNIEGNAKANRIIGTSANDTLNGAAGNDTLTGGDGADIFIYDGKGADVITDYAAGEDTLKISSGSVSSYTISGSDATFKIGSGSIKVSGGKNKAITVVDSKNKVTTYDSGLIYDGTVAKAKAVTVSAAYGNTLASYGASVITIDSSARTKALNITGNAAANKITGTSANDTINGGAGNDTLYGGKGKDLFVYESGDGNDVIADYTAGQDTIKIVGGISSYSISGADAVFKIDSGSVKVTGGKTSAITVVDENKNVSTYQSGAIYNSASATKATAITLTSGYGNSLTAGSTVVTVDASPRTSVIKIVGNDKNNVLIGSSGKDTIDGGKGADSITGGKGNDTLTGGAGRDVFIYANGDGSDVITDYVSGEDLIKLTSGEVKDYSVKNGDAVLKIGSGAITLKGVGGNAISVKDADGVLRTYSSGLIYNATKVSRSTAVTITSGYEDEEFGNYGASVETIDASSRSKALEIIGNTGANYILGTKGKDTIDGGKGADTIIGGKGNDLLTGGRGDDVFYFSGSDGNDTITDYAAGDIISVGGAVSYSTKGNDAVLKIGTGNVTLQNAADAAVTIVGADKVASVYGSGEVTTETYIGKVTIPSDAFTYNGHSYYIFDSGATWDEAKSYAEELGGHLVTITDSDEQAAVQNLLAAHSNAKNSYWMGGYRDDKLGWQWITGENWSYTHWGYGQPDGDNRNGVLCDALMMYYSTANNWLLGDWNDFFRDGVNGQTFFGTDNFGYIVEWETVNSSASGTDTVYVTLPPETVTVGGDTVTVEVTLPPETVTVYSGDGGGGSVIAGTSGNDTLYGTAGDDTLTGGAGRDIFVYAGGNDFDVITDYTVGEDRISIGTSSVKSGMLAGNDVIFAVGDGILKLNDAKGKTVMIFSGVGVDSVYSNGILDTVNAGARTVTLESDRTAAFSLSAYNSTTTLTALNVNGSSVRNAIEIYGDDSANILWGTSVGGGIWAGKGEDVIYCGAGNDRIYYWSDGGNDIIYNYQTGDEIRMRRVDEDDTTTFKNFVVSGGDVIINFTSGNTITLKDASDQIITLSEWDYNNSNWNYSNYYYNEGSSYYRGTFGYVTISGGTATLNKKYEGYFRPSMYADNPATVDASDVTNSIEIYGDDRANLIKASNGGSGIWAGKGNDTIYGGAGNDTLFYWSNEGNKTIYDYKGGDQIRLRRLDEDDTTTFKNFTVTDNDVVINFTNGNKITLKGAGDQTINLSEWNYGNNYYRWDYYHYSNAQDYYEGTFGYVTISGGTATLNRKYQGNCATYYYANVTNIDASNVTVATNLYGDDKANTLKMSNYGGSINGGGGNDTIYCGNGRDSIMYYSGGGSDVVYNIGANDCVSLNGCTAERVSVSGTDVIVKIADSSDRITLKNATGKNIYITGQGWQTYTATNGNAAVPWFAEDDTNFTTNADLDSLIDTGAALTDFKFDATPADIFAQDDSLGTAFNSRPPEQA